MTVLVASDLDRTLIYSTATLSLGGPDTATSQLRCVEIHEGRPFSYMTERAAVLLTELAGRATFVPATTRTREQYRRIHLPGPPPEFAVCANGGHLLIRGEPDPDWRSTVAARLAAQCAPLDELRAHLARVVDLTWLRKEIVADDLFVCLVVERALLSSSWVADLAGWAEPRGWTVSFQGHKVYALPKPLTKSAAVAEVARRTGATVTLAAGDSLLDASLLLLADHGWRPGHGELADIGWRTPHVTALSERGVVAGEKILRAFLRAATRGGAGCLGTHQRVTTAQRPQEIPDNAELDVTGRASRVGDGQA